MIDTADIQYVKTDGTDADFISLTGRLDEDLGGRYGEMQKQYAPFNRVDALRDAVVAYVGGVPAACGAFKAYGDDSVEIKRMFVATEYRRRGLAKGILSMLEETARGRGYHFAVLETGVGQPEAIALYKFLGYTGIDNYGQYAGNANSVCMRKTL